MILTSHYACDPQSESDAVEYYIQRTVGPFLHPGPVAGARSRGIETGHVRCKASCFRGNVQAGNTGTALLCLLQERVPALQTSPRYLSPSLTNA